VFSVASRSVGAVFEELAAFFRPSIIHVREERERLELMRDEEGDAAGRLGGNRGGLSVTVAADWDGPRGPRRDEPPLDSRGLVT
jgi:hypothetical protein